MTGRVARAPRPQQPSRRTRAAYAAAIAVTVCASALAARSAPAAAEPQPPRATPTIGQDGKDVEWVPTPPELIETMLEMAAVTADDVVIDLGSGDGRTVIAAAALGARAVGVEYDPGLVALSKERAATAGVADRARFVTANLFDVDLTQATVVTLFLLPDLNLKLRPMILGLAPGTRIVSNTWDMDEWTADETIVIDPCPSWCTALLWIVPAKVGGAWQLGGGELTLTQRFQMVSGTLGVNGTVTPVEAGRLRGDEITFRAGETRYRGRVSGDTMEGTAGGEGRSVRWRASRIAR